MKKQLFLGKRYARLMTGSYLPFTIYLTFFIVIILIATMSVSTNVVQTYPCSIINKSDFWVIEFENSEPMLSKNFYLYTDKNLNQYKLTVDEVSHEDNLTRIYVSEPKFLEDPTFEFEKKQVFIEIPIGEKSLLRRMIPLGDDTL
ncbi:hypothetical protein MUB24_22615 [Lederbergia sp. NSJ-179]|uniref:hypothetical protein n=1 Tax=Lederbergia sp. NSJ-179 TaxID=2931402 RepID=UPI001FD04729|nr:hypothetical protein [Lederbergia sp. NSJ-179]MCJ7843612.1 hypothetical protein [Lederbergia sp. NSJ-179]